MIIPLLFCFVTVAHQAAVPIACAGFTEASSAYERGDYVTAFKEMKPLAEQGNPVAQLNLGTMYNLGKGVPQDYTEAVNWYRKAAEQGNLDAQYNLGLMCVKGEGVKQDYVQAYMWFTLAASKGDVDAQRNRDSIAARMTSSQIAEAQRLAREWNAKGKD
jgi:TPR repeat protein